MFFRFCPCCLQHVCAVIIVISLSLPLFKYGITLSERTGDDDARRFSIATRRPGPPVTPRTRRGAVAAASTTTGRVSSSLEDLATPATSAHRPPSPMFSVPRQLIRDLEQRQLQLRKRGILAAGETLDTGCSVQQ